MKKFTLIVNMNVLLHDDFCCDSRVKLGLVNNQEKLDLVIPDGDFKSQNMVLKKSLKTMKFNLNNFSSTDVFKFHAFEKAKNEINEILSLKEPLKYIHGRYQSSIFQTEFI